MRKIYLLFFLLLSLSLEAKNTTNSAADNLIAFAQKQIGKPYKSGSVGPHAFDCSGFTSYVYGHLGYKLYRSSGDQVRNGQEIFNKKQAQKGDLIFFKGSNVYSSQIGHVGIVVSDKGENPIRFIHVSSSSGVRIDNLNDKYYNDRFVTLSRILKDGEVKETPIVTDDIYDEKPKKEKSSASDKKHTEPTEEEINSIGYEVLTSENSCIFHTVKKGDTLYNISKRYNCTVGDLKIWNDLTSNEISIGQQLAVSGSNPQSGGTIYTVKKGDTLYHISKIMNCTVGELKKWNNLNDNAISIGQQLMIKK